MKKLLLTIFFALVSAFTFAQNFWGSSQSNITIGIMGGSNVAFLQAKLPAGSTVSNNPLYPASFGVNADFKMSDYLSIRPGVFYSGKGGLIQYVESSTISGIGSFDQILEQQFKLNYLEVPVNLIGHIPLSDNLNILIGAGPYVAMYLSGKVMTTVGSSDPETDNLKSGKNGEFKSTDLGASTLLGFETGSGIIIDINYDIGLTNILQNSNPNSTIQQLKTGAVYLSVGFAFK